MLVGSGARTGVCIDPLIAHGLLPDLLAPREAVSMATGPTPPVADCKFLQAELSRAGEGGRE